MTFLLVVIGLVFFRAESISQAFHYLAGIADVSLFSKPMYLFKSEAKIAFFCSMAVILVEWFQRRNEHGLEIASYPAWGRRMTYIVFMVLIVLFSGKNISFIYFQF